MKILWKRNYEALGQLHNNSLFLGMMHFQDLYNYDIERTERCDISYLSPDGRIIRFCGYNVLPDLYRDKIIQEQGIPIEEWKKKYSGSVGTVMKYNRNVEALKNTQIYQRAYQG